MGLWAGDGGGIGGGYKEGGVRVRSGEGGEGDSWRVHHTRPLMHNFTQI